MVQPVCSVEQRAASWSQLVIIYSVRLFHNRQFTRFRNLLSFVKKQGSKPSDELGEGTRKWEDDEMRDRWEGGGPEVDGATLDAIEQSKQRLLETCKLFHLLHRDLKGM